MPEVTGINGAQTMCNDQLFHRQGWRCRPNPVQIVPYRQLKSCVTSTQQCRWTSKHRGGRPFIQSLFSAMPDHCSCISVQFPRGATAVTTLPPLTSFTGSSLGLFVTHSAGGSAGRSPLSQFSSQT